MSSWKIEGEIFNKQEVVMAEATGGALVTPGSENIQRNQISGSDKVTYEGKGGRERDGPT